ncbi:hypothetical protein N5079_22190 [Planotetraspora sp. A-T 1434]|nr:hypothetical protein [Planotetraspora sp. A-T 1434]MCT9932922.1 hypothetical protein [Planotetraspora sp. A-T 1434]
MAQPPDAPKQDLPRPDGHPRPGRFPDPCATYDGLRRDYCYQVLDGLTGG